MRARERERERERETGERVRSVQCLLLHVSLVQSRLLQVSMVQCRLLQVSRYVSPQTHKGAGDRRIRTLYGRERAVSLTGTNMLYMCRTQ